MDIFKKKIARCDLFTEKITLGIVQGICPLRISSGSKKRSYEAIADKRLQEGERE